jgi:hypothetical protein
MIRDIAVVALLNALCEFTAPMPTWSRRRGESEDDRSPVVLRIRAGYAYFVQLAVVFLWYELEVLDMIPSAVVGSESTAMELRVVHHLLAYVAFGLVFTIWLDDLVDVGASVKWCSTLFRLYQFFSTRIIACIMIMTSTRTASTWHPFWTALGYTTSAAKGAGTSLTLKYAYYFCRVGFSVVCTVIGLTGIVYWNPIQGWFKRLDDAKSRVIRSSTRKALMRTILWHCALGLVLSGLWITASNSGIPRPDAIKRSSSVSTHFVEPWIPGHKVPHAKNHGQTMIAIAYATLIAHSLNFMHDDGLWISQVLSWQIPAQIYNFFGVIYAIVALGGGTIFHPTWYTNGWTPKWATSRVLDWIFYLGTGQLTIVGTPLLTYAVVKHLREHAFKPFTTGSQNFFVRCMRHSMLSILISGFWMIFVSTGVPMPDAELTAKFGIPPVHKLDVNESIKMHHFDLILSVIVMGNGYAVTAVDDVMQTNFKLNQFIGTVWKYSMYSHWVYFLSAKLLLHCGERFSTPNAIALLLRFKREQNTREGHGLRLFFSAIELYSFTAMVLIFMIVVFRITRAVRTYLSSSGNGAINWTNGKKLD